MPYMGSGQPDVQSLPDRQLGEDLLALRHKTYAGAAHPAGATRMPQR